jgi:hypothetical protein
VERDTVSVAGSLPDVSIGAASPGVLLRAGASLVVAASGLIATAEGGTRLIGAPSPSRRAVPGVDADAAAGVTRCTTAGGASDTDTDG